MIVKKYPMHKIRERYKKLNIDRKWLILGLSLLVLSFFISIGPILFLVIFSVGNAFLLTIDRYINAPIDVELSTFSAILMTFTYGLNWGIATAILTKVAAIAYHKKFRVDHLFMIGGYVLAAFMANILPGNIVLLGVLATLVVNVYVVFISKFVTMLSNYEIVMYGATNTIFNIVLFIGFSEIILPVMLFFK